MSQDKDDIVRALELLSFSLKDTDLLHECIFDSSLDEELALLERNIFNLKASSEDKKKTSLLKKDT